ncbi:unnamed protein product [Effrenium voratum]|nr:unnamed protein product [Effrenium voratum]
MPLDPHWRLPREARLVPYTALFNLPIPWPRCQDIRGLHEEAYDGDSLVVISQSWSHQMHPDPTGVKAAAIISTLKTVAVKLRAEGRLLVFCDFLSIPQPPTGPQHDPWTESDSLAVQEVMEALPRLMFKADAVIHINALQAKLVMEGEKYSTTFKELQRSCRLRQIGNVVQVWEEFARMDPFAGGGYESSEPRRKPRSFDQVLRLGNRRVKSLDDLPDEASAHCVCAPRWCTTSDGEDHAVEMMRAPFGYRIEVEPTQQGRTYFDRFISIVKVALMEEAAAPEVIFANNADVKRDILNGGARLRKAAQTGPDVLAHELRSFTEELESKTFIPVGFELAEGNRDFETKQREMVSSLMQVFLEDLNIGVSLSLWRALRDERLDDCRRLLQDKADPNIVDGKGQTCLHHAAQARSTSSVSLLVHFGASMSARDHRGCTPAHVIPLFADDTTKRLIMFFLEQDCSALFETDKAGVSAIERFFLWSLMAADGEPWEPMSSRLKDIFSLEEALPFWPSMDDFGISSLHVAFPEATSPPARVEKRRLQFNGLLRTIYVVHPCHVTGDPVLYLGFCRLVPWPLQEPALRVIVSADLLQTDDLDPNGQAFFTDLYTFIDTLPLPYRLMVIDSTFGVGVPLLWRLQDRLKQVLVINCSWIFRHHHHHSLQSTMQQTLKEEVLRLSALASARDAKSLVKHFGDFALSASMAKAQSGTTRNWQFLANEYEAGLTNACDAFWQMSAVHPVWNFKHLTTLLGNLQPWRPNNHVDILLAYGSHTPPLAVQESTYNLQELLPGSLTTFIGLSSWLWHIEGVPAVQEVARLAELMCKSSSAGTESLNALLVQQSPVAKVTPSKSPHLGTVLGAKSKSRPPLLRHMSSLKSADIANALKAGAATPEATPGPAAPGVLPEEPQASTVGMPQALYLARLGQLHVNRVNPGRVREVDLPETALVGDILPLVEDRAQKRMRRQLLFQGTVLKNDQPIKSLGPATGPLELQLVCQALRVQRLAEMPEDYEMLHFGLCGENSVGKSSFLKRYVEECFQLKKICNYGVEFKTAKLLAEDVPVKLFLWDWPAGHVNIRPTPKVFFNQKTAVMLVMDVTNPDCLEDVDHWLNVMKANSIPTKLLIGNKVDLGRRIDSAAAEKFAEERGLVYFETSAKDGTGVEEAVGFAIFDALEKMTPRVKRAPRTLRSPCDAYVAPVA